MAFKSLLKEMEDKFNKIENFIEEDHQENLVDYNLIENDGNNMDDLEDQQENFSNSTVTGTVEESVIDSRNSFLFENDEETNDNDIDNNPIDDNDIRDDENNVYMILLLLQPFSCKFPLFARKNKRKKRAKQKEQKINKKNQ